ncbi:MAG: glycosyltransferase family 2 protein [Deltaproteobacteria bacterium]|nr:glycosyltransferase family 2 protein [Deltaproteobacteria bacterium]
MPPAAREGRVRSFPGNSLRVAVVLYTRGFSRSSPTEPQPQNDPAPAAAAASRPPHLSAISARPELSIVIPVYNEEEILREAAEGLLERTRRLGVPFEVIFAENGSRDGTLKLLSELHEAHPEIRYLSCGEPNYGLALKKGIEMAEGTFVICDEIDLCDAEFHRAAVGILDSGASEMVIGSKLARGAKDDRPFVRHFATVVINLLLRIAVGFKGTDTHGLKAFRRSNLLPVVASCKVDRDLFASEFVVRAERSGKKIVEIPVTIQEKRKPSINLFRRVPNVLKNLVRLFYIVRIKG